MGHSCHSLLPGGADCFGSVWQCAYLNVLPSLASPAAGMAGLVQTSEGEASSSWLFLCLPGHLWPLSCGFDHESCAVRLAGQEMEVPSFWMP